jgi:outer membrane murein-binding lipoprotein Lpp
MKRKFLLFAIILSLVLSAGCVSNPNRNWFGTNAVGADVETGRQSTTAILASDRQAKRFEGMDEDVVIVARSAEGVKDDVSEVEKVIEERAPEIIPETKPHTESISAHSDEILLRVAALEEAIKGGKKDNKVSVELLKDIHERAQGKKYMSKTKLIMLWALGIGVVLLIFGIAIRTLPFFQPVERLVNGVANAAMDMGSGAWHSRRKWQIRHLDRTSTIDNTEMDNDMQAQIMEERAREMQEETLRLRREAKNVRKGIVAPLNEEPKADS